jgi:hypothetical protein
MTDNEKLAYIAGLIDGEGYIGIKKQPPRTNSMGKRKGINYCYYERLTVAGINKPMITMLIKTFKVGKIYFHKHSKLSRRGYWSWDVTNKLAISVINKVYPFLQIKKPEADIVLKLRESKKIRYKIVPKNITKEREALYQSIKKLHTFI